MDTREVTLRRATAADAEALWQVRIQAIRAGCCRHYAAEDIAAWVANPVPDTFPAFIAVEPFFVAEIAGQIVGFAGLKRESAELNALFVLPELAGKGLGTRLLGSVEDAARDLQFASLSLESSLNAVPFYKAASYREGAQGMHLTTGRVQIPCVHMQKNLTGVDAA